VFRDKPWYLTGEPLTRHHCPCGCGAIVIAIEPELPLMRWPVTKGGDAVQRSAREQTGSLLQPYMDALLNDPRERLPATGNTAMNPTGGCGNSDTH